MATNFNELKKARKADNSKLVDAINKLQGGEGRPADEDRFWKPETDKSGNGYAVIRFLPAPKGEDVPFVRIWDHGFQGAGGWYIENSLTTLGQPDPVSEYNSQLWNSGVESNKDIVRKQKRRLNFYANILVITDSANPSNEGKVFLYKFGKKIFDKINDVMNPQFADEDPINPFDFWEGANFKLKIRQVEGYRNYDKSEFDSPSAVSDDDDQLQKIWESQHSLQDLVDPKNFKSYVELKTKLERVLQLGGTTSPSQSAVERDVNDSFEQMSQPATRKQTPAKPIPEAKSEVEEDSAPWASSDDDDDLAFFDKLANE